MLYCITETVRRTSFWTPSKAWQENHSKEISWKITEGKFTQRYSDPTTMLLPNRRNDAFAICFNCSASMCHGVSKTVSESRPWPVVRPGTPRTERGFEDRPESKRESRSKQVKNRWNCLSTHTFASGSATFEWLPELLKKIQITRNWTGHKWGPRTLLLADPEDAWTGPWSSLTWSQT